MIVLSNSAAQILQPGQSIQFDNEVLHTGCGECHRKNSSGVKLRAKGGIYSIHFSANAGGYAGAVQLSVQASGMTLPETTMTTVPAAITDFMNVATATGYKNYCSESDVITVTNTGANVVTVAPGSSLFITRNA